MIQEDGSGTRSPSGERRSKKAMKIQGGRNSAGSSSSPPAPTGGRLLSGKRNFMEYFGRIC